MAFLEIKNVRVAGISAGVPKIVVSNLNEEYRFSSDYDNETFVEMTGVNERRYDDTLTTSDLCFRAAEKLIEELNWKPKEIDALIFVSQTLDFFLPATACILQDKLGLPKSCYAEDIQLGCSGWVYGTSTLASLMQNGHIRKALLMCGDAKRHAPQSKFSSPLFGYAGTVTALEFIEGYEGFKGDFGTDGSGYEAIIIPGGGSRNPVTEESLVLEEVDGKSISPLQSRMKGMDVFSFGITTAPKSVKKLAEHFGYDYLNSDFFIFHQANKKMNDMIIKKLKLASEKVPMCMMEFGNTSSASIPLTIVTQIADELRNGIHNLTCCGFGVGLSWGTLNFNVENLAIPELLEVESNDNII